MSSNLVDTWIHLTPSKSNLRLNMSVTAYEYNRLNSPTSIRLFRIESELTDGNVSCILEQFDQNIQPYNALSYYWGDPEHTRQIYLGGKLIGVHETLWEFLDQMHKSQDTRTWFWTDFLCLDQGSKTEIDQQVQRMGDIYADAKQTISWLGCEGSSAARHVPKLGESLELIATRVSLKREAVEDFFSQLPNWTTIMHRRVGGSRQDTSLPKASPQVMQLGYG